MLLQDFMKSGKIHIHVFLQPDQPKFERKKIEKKRSGNMRKRKESGREKTKRGEKLIRQKYENTDIEKQNENLQAYYKWNQ